MKRGQREQRLLGNNLAMFLQHVDQEGLVFVGMTTAPTNLPIGVQINGFYAYFCPLAKQDQVIEQCRSCHA